MYPKRFVPHQKMFDLKVGQIDYVHCFHSNGNGAWKNCFKTPHVDGLSGCCGTLNVKGLIGEGNFVVQ